MAAELFLQAADGTGSVKTNTVFGTRYDTKNCNDPVVGSECELRNKTVQEQRGQMLAQNSGRRSKKQVHFRLHPTKKVVGTMDGPQISSLGGIVLLGELEKYLRLVRGAAEALKDWRIHAKYSLHQLLLQRVLLICAGLEDGIDSNYHRYDPAVLTALGLSVSTDRLASQPTISLFETGMDSKNCYRLAMFMLTFYIATRRTVPKEVILDFDGSCFPVYGDQQGSAYRGHYETDMYFPLLVFDQDGWLITAILRPGSHGEAKLVVPVLKRIVPAFRKAWGNVRITVRADAGFNSPDIYDWCEDQGKEDAQKTVYYLIRLKTGPRENGVFTLVNAQRRTLKRAFRRTFGTERYLGEEGAKRKNADQTKLLALPTNERTAALEALRSRKKRGFCDFFYRTIGKNQWRQDRRIISVIDHSDRGDEQMFLVTNIVGHAPNWLYEKLYCQRGKAETYIHELKSLHATRLSGREFWTNQFRLLEHALSYLLLYKLRELLPPAQARMSVGSVRDNLIKVAVVVKDLASRVVLQWTNHYFWIRPFLFVCRGLERLPIRC